MGRLKVVIFVCFIFSGLLLVACAPQEHAEVDEPQSGEFQPEPAEELTSLPVPSPTTPPEPTEPEPTLPPEPLPPDLQVIEFTAEGGTVLTGTYYPAAVIQAPGVILMHQFNFDEQQWDAIAPWLQNRCWRETALRSDLLVSARNQTGDEPYLNTSWFPEVPDDLNVAVFTFTFRNCEGGCEPAKIDREGWVQDALAALETFGSFPEVDSSQIIMAGTSIGADAAVDACLLYANENPDNACLGAMSVSPDSYLEMAYDKTVEKLVAGGKGTPVLCFASENDTPCLKTCESYEGDGYQKIIVPDEDKHGIYLYDPEIKPNPLVELLGFIIGLLD